MQVESVEGQVDRVREYFDALGTRPVAAAA
jgi:hypothetical protein